MNPSDPSETEPILSLRVHAITYRAAGIHSYELVDPNGKELPAFTAGAHIDIHLPGSLIRQYSLCNSPDQRQCYEICVQREDDGEGGSKAVHDSVTVGQTVNVSHPRNNFALAPDASRHIFLAGGIGITPIMAMLHTVRLSNKPWQLIYCTRESNRTAFLDELAVDAGSNTGQVTIHHDDGKPENSFDLSALLSRFEPGTHLYYCGPTGFMNAAADASTHWPTQAVHCEYFSLPAESLSANNALVTGSGLSANAADGFQIKVNSTGAVYDVPESQSIVDVLAEHGITVETSCEAGLCGTCRTDYIDGQPDHRDHILSDEDRATSVLICCARSLTPMLVLDL